MRIAKYITGVKIKFDKKDNHNFITYFDGDIDNTLLLIGLCEAINDVCKHYNINTNDILKAYIKYGSLNKCEEKPKKRRGRPRKEEKGE